MPHPSIVLTAAIKSTKSPSVIYDILRDHHIEDGCVLELDGYCYSQIIIHSNTVIDIFPHSLGDLVFFDFIVDGHGNSITLDDLNAQIKSIESWCIDVCNRYPCIYEIKVTACYLS
jgi:hypothetical protein